MSLSSPAPFGDLAEPTFEQDAAGALRNVLLAIRRERGQAVHDCASYAIAALGRTDGMSAKDLGDAIAFELDLDSPAGPNLFAAILELERRSVCHYRAGRLYLNPAAVAVVEREAHR